jgi:hypothetical protein
MPDESTAMPDDYPPRTQGFLAILDEMRELHLRKGADYGRDDDPFANITASEQWGIPAWQGAMMRGTDKIVRLQSYARTGTLANEGAEDALIDLACYAVIALTLLREEPASEPEPAWGESPPNRWTYPSTSLPSTPPEVQTW